MGHRTVMLSTFASLSVNSAKDLARWAPRSFADAQDDTVGPMRLSLPDELESMHIKDTYREAYMK